MGNTLHYYIPTSKEPNTQQRDSGKLYTNSCGEFSPLSNQFRGVPKYVGAPLVEFQLHIL